MCSFKMRTPTLPCKYAQQINARADIHTHTHTHKQHTHTHTHTLTLTHISANLSTHAHTHTDTPLPHLNPQKNMHTLTPQKQTHTHVHATHTSVHTCTHTQTHTHTLQSSSIQCKQNYQRENLLEKRNGRVFLFLHWCCFSIAQPPLSPSDWWSGRLPWQQVTAVWNLQFTGVWKPVCPFMERRLLLKCMHRQQRLFVQCMYHIM